MDQEGGVIASAPWVAPEPAAAEVGRRKDPDEARNIAARMGRQLLRAGINTDFAPVVDTGYGAAIGDRSYGEDPELVARMGAAAVQGFEEAGVISAAKHFPNHGPATSDSHVSLPVIRHDDKDSERTIYRLSRRPSTPECPWSWSGIWCIRPSTPNVLRASPRML